MPTPRNTDRAPTPDRPRPMGMADLVMNVLFLALALGTIGVAALFALFTR